MNKFVKFRPIHNKVLIKLDPFENKTPGGLWKPPGAHHIEHRTGTIMAVGPGKFCAKKGIRIPCTLKLGDKVLLDRYLGDVAEFEQNGETYRILPEDTIHCRIDDSKGESLENI